MKMLITILISLFVNIYCYDVPVIYFNSVDRTYYLIINKTYCEIDRSNQYDTINNLYFDVNKIPIKDNILKLYTKNTILSCPLHLTQNDYYISANVLYNNLQFFQSYDYIGNYKNPTILPYNNKLLMLQRWEPRLFIMDESLHNIKSISYIDNYKLTANEGDARMIQLPNGNIHVSMCFYANGPIITRELSYNTKLKKFIFSDPILYHILDKQHDGRQKNWIPFLYNNTIYFIQQILPLNVYKIPDNLNYSLVNNKIKEMNIIKVSKEKCKFQIPNWVYSEPRGGTQALYIPGLGYLAFYHTLTNPRKYYIGAYVISSNPPFQLLKISPYPITHKDFSDQGKYYHNIKFTTSYYLVDVNNEIINDNTIYDYKPAYIMLIMGYKDKFGYRMKMNYDVVIDSMIDVIC